MTGTTPASKALVTLGIDHQEFIHPGPVESLEQAAAERNQPVDQVVRSILFRLTEGEYAMVLMGGPRQISWKSLRNHFGQSRLTMAKPEEVQEITGYQIGGVSPFGMPNPLPMLVDKNILDQPSVSLGSGVRGTAIMITIPNMIKALGEVESGHYGA